VQVQTTYIKLAFKRLEDSQELIVKNEIFRTLFHH
jgi:hypothetical protein